MQTRRGAYATFCLDRTGNHYHWFINCLTRLWALELAGKTHYKLIVPARPTPLQLQTLLWLGYPPERLARFEPQHWSVERLLVPSLASLESEVSPEACRWLRDRLLRAAPMGGRAKRKLLISRRLAGKRRLLSEDKLFARLEKRGFERICAEQLSIGQQIGLFREAAVVVGTHGAGLTNMLFMPESSLVVELLRYCRVKTMFFSLANALGHRYGCVTDAPEEPVRPLTSTADMDFEVPVERVEQALEMHGA
jgi:capsular polysaccharide biosynthesis protein